MTVQAEWSSLEEVLLAEAVQKHGEAHWDRVCEELTSRKMISCRRAVGFFTVDSCKGKLAELRAQHGGDASSGNGTLPDAQLIGALRAKRLRHLQLCIAHLDREISELRTAAAGAANTTTTASAANLGASKNGVSSIGGTSKTERLPAAPSRPPQVEAMEVDERPPSANDNDNTNNNNTANTSPAPATVPPPTAAAAAAATTAATATRARHEGRPLL
mmetsp:Transcript_6090/g.22342  ORF Transcript_6090/g.22342 Transcript_6090/m.22342 type:complete len:217 (-) Transcript_6090:1274-1924(-)